MTMSATAPISLFPTVTGHALQQLRGRLSKLRAVADQMGKLGHETPRTLLHEVASLASAIVLVEVPCIGCKDVCTVASKVDDPRACVPRVVLCAPCDERIAA